MFTTNTNTTTTVYSYGLPLLLLLLLLLLLFTTTTTTTTTDTTTDTDTTHTVACSHERNAECNPLRCSLFPMLLQVQSYSLSLLLFSRLSFSRARRLLRVLTGRGQLERFLKTIA